ncbi:transporter [Tatumella ptyseos]|uniref:transporter n=1 Tax=Tatumella ptyseos TaxID=82987 RepID=UPI0026EA63F7|nr:transporter [Tatumella ptyseos]WKX27644.1 transporter [Tatumella ptyseos]
MHINLKNSGLALLVSITATKAFALEIAPGDYEPIPAGGNVLGLYAKYSSSHERYLQDKKLSSSSTLRTQVELLRFIHSVGISDGTVLQPQFILPYGDLTAGSSARALGSNHGIGDFILAAPLLTTVASHRDIFSFGPYFYLPTGSYDHNKALNVGENRWRMLWQAGYIHHFTDRWAVDTAADVSWFSHNNDYGASKATLREKPLYEYQAYLRYSFSPLSHFGVGGGYISGGESSVDGINQQDTQRTFYLSASMAYLFTPHLQGLIVIGKDQHTESGFKQDKNVTLRLATFF